MINEKPHLVIYDFGFCWKIPDQLSSKITFLEKTLIQLKDETIPIKDKKNNIIDMFYILLLEKCSLLSGVVLVQPLLDGPFSAVSTQNELMNTRRKTFAEFYQIEI